MDDGKLGLIYFVLCLLCIYYVSDRIGILFLRAALSDDCFCFGVLICFKHYLMPFYRMVAMFILVIFIFFSWVRKTTT